MRHVPTNPIDHLRSAFLRGPRINSQDSCLLGIVEPGVASRNLEGCKTRLEDEAGGTTECEMAVGGDHTRKQMIGRLKDMKHDQGYMRTLGLGFLRFCGNVSEDVQWDGGLAASRLVNSLDVRIVMALEKLSRGLNFRGWQKQVVRSNIFIHCVLDSTSHLLGDSVLILDSEIDSSGRCSFLEVVLILFIF